MAADAGTDMPADAAADAAAAARTAGPTLAAGSLEDASESAASIGASSAVRDQGQVAVGLTNTTHFLRPVTTGRLEVEAEALSQGRGQQLWRVDVTDGSGRLVAHGEVRLQNVAGRG